MKHVRKKRETQRVYVHYTVYQIFLNRCIHMAHAFMNKKCKILISSTVLRTYRQWSYKNFSRESLLSKIPDSRESNFLRITDASVHDAGKYMCIASNGYPPPVSHTFQLWVKRKSIETAVASFFPSTVSVLKRQSSWIHPKVDVRLPSINVVQRPKLQEANATITIYNMLQ